jgi:erythritol kinase (D-erythritol 1-phosphate-forming)
MSVVGLDVGTSQVKAVRFDADWTAADSATGPATVLRSPGGHCEQDMHSIWDAAARVLSDVVGRSPDRVELVAITAQGDGCWLVGGAGEPVANALLWNDSRAGPIVEGWAADGSLEAAFRISGCYGAPGLAHAQLSWLAAHEPSVVARAARLLSCGSWIYRRMTGREVLEESDAANPFCDALSRRYDDGLLDLFGIADLRRLLPPVVSGRDAVAPLAADAAARLDLPAGTPVVLAPYDVVSTAIGSGVVTPGDAFAVLGTTLCAGVLAADPMLSRPANGMTLPAGTRDAWLIAYATLIGTEVLDWAAGVLGVADAEAVVTLAASSAAAEPPLLLPYLSPAGERSPFLDPDVRGSLHGLDIRHTRADIARAVLDGLTLAVRDCLQAAGKPESIAVSGGGARSPVWCQAISDALAVPVMRPDVAEVGARGAALVGATAMGEFATLADAVSASVAPGRVHRSDPVETARYDAAFARYLDARPS